MEGKVFHNIPLKKKKKKKGFKIVTVDFDLIVCMYYA